MTYSTQLVRRLTAWSPLMLIALCCLLPILGGCADRGPKLEFDGSELYYTTNVTEADAKKLGDFLVKEEFFKGEKKTVQLDKAGKTYHVRWVVSNEDLENKEPYEFAQQLAPRPKFTCPTIRSSQSRPTAPKRSPELDAPRPTTDDPIGVPVGSLSIIDPSLQRLTRTCHSGLRGYPG
jgi:hypothetical protein